MEGTSGCASEFAVGGATLLTRAGKSSPRDHQFRQHPLSCQFHRRQHVAGVAARREHADDLAHEPRRAAVTDAVLARAGRSRQ